MDDGNIKTKNPKALAGCAVALLATPISIALRGWVLSILWHWFVCPLGVRPIGVAWAMGLSVVISMFTTRASSKVDEEPSPWVRLATVCLADPLVTLLFGWIYHLIMTH